MRAPDLPMREADASNPFHVEHALTRTRSLNLRTTGSGAPGAPSRVLMHTAPASCVHTTRCAAEFHVELEVVRWCGLNP
jgi:hypothetical protein